MNHISLRRGALSRAAGAAGAVVLAAAGLALGAGAGPASAAPTEHFNVSTGFDRTVPLRAAGQDQAYRPLTITFYDWTDNPLRGVRIAVDGSALHGFAELNLPHGCAYTSSDHLHESCALGDVPHGAGEFSVGVRAAAGAKAGRSGRVVFTMTAANGTQEVDSLHPKDTVGVTVGDGPDLAINDIGRTYKVARGGSTALPLRITNVGNREGKGVVIFVHDQYGAMTVPGNYSNCVYEHYDNGQRGAQCTFPDTVIKPGETLVPAHPFTVTAPADSHGDQIQYGAGLSGDDWIGGGQGTPGTGGPLELVPAAGSFAYDPTQDIDSSNNLYYTNLDTGLITDIAGVNSSVDAVIGKDTALTFTVRNTGDTPIDHVEPSAGSTFGVTVDFPGTVRVTDVPDHCRLLHGGPMGLSAYPPAKEPVVYACTSTATLKPGQTHAFTFHVVVLKSVSGQYAGMYAGAWEDPTADLSNNVAHVTINAKSASSGGTSATSGTSGASTTSGTSGSGNAPGTDGSDSGKQLAATGSSSATLWTAVGGVAVVGAGAVALAAARRRRSATGGPVS